MCQAMDLINECTVEWDVSGLYCVYTYMKYLYYNS